MKKYLVFKIVNAVIILGLIGGCFHFYMLSKKPDNKIIIGTPINTSRTNISKQVNSVEYSNIIILGLINAKSIANQI